MIAGIASNDVSTRYEAEPKRDFDVDQVKTELRALQHDFDALLREAGVAAIMYPTSPVLPPLIRADGDRADDTMVLNGREVSSAFTPVRHSRYAAGLGIPALTIPVGDASSLPVGMEFAVPAHDGPLLLGVGLAVELALR